MEKWKPLIRILLIAIPVGFVAFTIVPSMKALLIGHAFTLWGLLGAIYLAIVALGATIIVLFIIGTILYYVMQLYSWAFDD